MKLLKKVWFVFILIALLIIPIVSYTATTTVTNETELQAAFNDPNIDTIIVANSIQISNTLALPDTNRTITIQSDPSNNVFISASGTNYIFNYTTTNNNLNINFENITLDGTVSSAIFYIDAQNGSLNLNNVIEVNGNNRGNPNGGSIYKNSGTLNLTNSSFDRNIVGGSGGTIYNNSGNTNIENTSFTNSSSGSEGGIIYHNSGNLTIVNSNFANSGAGRSGGAIYNNGTLTVNNAVSFTNNSANDGGAIYTTDYTNLIIDGNNGVINFSGNESQNPTSIEGNDQFIAIHNNQVIGDYTTSVTPYLYNNDDINFVANLLMYESNFPDPVQNLPPNVYYQTGQEVIVSKQTPVRVGYAFSGWNTFPDGSGTQYNPGDSFIMPDTRVSLFAQWQPIFYMLAFNANTSDPVENLPSSIHYTVGEIITLPEQTPIRTGYTFAGWNTTSDGSGTQYGPGDTFVGFEQDSTLYAQWTLNPVNLEYNANTTDVVENLPPTESYTPGEIATISEQIPTRVGYTFTGWNSEPDGTGTSYNPSQSVLIPDNGLILYAQWTQNQNYLNFNPNTTDPVDNLPEDISYTPGNTVTILDQIPTREGYHFIGWNTRPDGTGTSYQPGDNFIAPEGDVTLYAQWEEDNTPIIIVVLIGLFFLLIFIGIIIFSLYYADCNCECYIDKKKE